MPNLVHITQQRNAARLLRGGVAARSRGWDGDRGVYAMAVLSDFTLTHQWARELRRFKSGVLVAADLRIPDTEPVTAGHYGREPDSLTAAEAVAMLRALDDPRGFQIFVPRRITPGEVRRVRAIPQGTGWRYVPGSHGRRPCPCPVCLAFGTPGSGKLRRRLDPPEPRTPKPRLMADLRAAVTSEEIIDALSALAHGRRGGAEELAFLIEHPDPEVRDMLSYVLDTYRGAAARRLKARIVLPGRHGQDD
jgi:hypothetical protein